MPAPLTLAPVASVTTPRMDAAGEQTAQSARVSEASVRVRARGRNGAPTVLWVRREEVHRKLEIGMIAPSFPSERESDSVRLGPVS